PGGQPARRDLQSRALDARGIVALDQRVVVGEEEERVDIRAPAGGDRRADRARVVAQVRGAGGGDAGEDSGLHGVRLWCRGVARQRIRVDLPNSDSTRSTASFAVALRLSNAGFSSTMSSEPSRPESAIISMHSCASR